MLTRPPDFLDQVSTPEDHAIVARRDSSEGSYIVVRSDAKDPFEVLVLAGSRPGRPLAALVPLDADTPGRVEALVRYWRAGRGKPVPTDKRITAQQRRRLRLMMQAADGRSDSASYREIGIALFGSERIASEPWKTSALRDMVIGLVEGATALIGGGYLQLLRHRRRT